MRSRSEADLHGTLQNAVGDFNGDGKDDLVAWNTNGQTAIALSTGTSFQQPVTYWSNWSFNGSLRNAMGDFNGDGKDDLVAWNTNGQTAIALSTGTSFAQPVVYWSNWSLNGSLQNAVGDFNGDGKDDLIAWNTNGQTAVAISTGTNFQQPVTYWSSMDFHGVRNVVGDVNGDGKDDIIAWNDAETAVELSSGSSFSNPVYWSQDSDFHGTVQNAVGDFDGDCADDLVAWNNAATAISTSKFPSPYPTSCRYGGRNHRVNTPAEIAAVVAAFDAAPDDNAAQALAAGLHPSDTAGVDAALRARVNNGDIIRKVSTGEVFYYAAGTYYWIPSAAVASAAGIDLGSVKRITATASAPGLAGQTWRTRRAGGMAVRTTLSTAMLRHRCSLLRWTQTVAPIRRRC